MQPRWNRETLATDPVEAARVLLGAVIRVDDIAARIVETEAYRGADDPASHSYRGKTARNAVMWGPAGHLYVYFTYGIHFCANVVATTEGEPGAVLLRAARITEGTELARTRRPAAKRDTDLAGGPAKLTSALGIHSEHNGTDLFDPRAAVRLEPRQGEEPTISSGPRVGISVATELPWRFWITDAPEVSTFRAGGKRRAGTSSESPGSHKNGEAGPVGGARRPSNRRDGISKRA